MQINSKAALTLATLAALGLAAAHPSAAQNLVTNGSFELGTNASGGTGVTGYPTGWYAPTGINGAPFSDRYFILTQGSGFYNNGATPNGTHVFGLTDYSRTDYVDTGLAQNVTGLVNGSTYTLSFAYNASASGPAPTLTVSMGGTSVFTSPAGGVTPVNTTGVYTSPFHTASVTFTATAASETLLLFGGSTLPSTASNLLVDNVVITLAGAPEPSQTAALGLGVLGLAGLTLKARKRSRISA